MAAEQTAKYGVAAIAIAIVIIVGAVASMSLATTTQPETSSTKATTSQTSSQSLTTVQLGSSSSGTSTQSSTTQGQGGSGVLSIYLTDAPPSTPTLKYLLVNVSSLEMVYQGNGTSSGAQATNVYILTVPSDVGTNVNLSSLQGQSLLLGGANMPSGKITSMFVNLTGAKAFYTDGSTEQVQVVADGKLMVPIQFGLQPNGSTDLTIDVTPSLASVSQGVVLAPVIDATAVETGQYGTTTETVTTTESLPPSTSTVTTTQTVTTPITLTTTVALTTTTTQTVTSTTALPPTTTTSTSTTTTTETSTSTSTIILPPTTTTVTATSTSTSTATTTVTTTSISTSTKTVTTTSISTSTKTVSSSSSRGTGSTASNPSAISVPASWMAPTFALVTLLATGVTALALPRFRRNAA